MRVEDAKVGAKVFWRGNGSEPSDYGVITGRHKFGDAVWVEWSGGDTLWIKVSEIELIGDETPEVAALGDAEKDAVMLLLRLGYTVTKGKV